MAAQDLDTFGGMIWPPVDFRLDQSPSLLIMSPRDRIERIENYLIKPDIPSEEAEFIEEAILESQDVSAIIMRTGGPRQLPGNSYAEARHAALA